MPLGQREAIGFLNSKLSFQSTIENGYYILSRLICMYGKLGGRVQTHKNLVFCNDYNTPVLSLAYRSRGILQTRYPLWSTIRYSIF